jgi:translocation and assembly module TamB
VSTSVAAPPEKKRRSKAAWAAAGLLLVGLLAGLAVYFNSNAFHVLLREKIVAELERASGGKVEMQSLTWKLSTLHFEARGLVIHGRESAGEIPYLQADRVAVDARIISFFSRKLALSKVAIDRPTLHLIIYPDGSTNQPSPKRVAKDGKATAEQLFDLAIHDVAIADGTLMLNQERIPFELKGERLSAGLTYSRQEGGYDGKIALSLLSARWRALPQQRGEVDLHVLLRETSAEIKSLKVVARNSTVQAHGTLSNYSHPEIALEYQASVDLPEAARLADVAQVKAGRAEVTGTLDYREGRYSSQGSLAVRALEWKDQTIHAANVDAASHFSVTPDRLSLARISARSFGGTAQGDLEISHWHAASRTPGRGENNGTAVFKISGWQINNLLQAVSIAGLPLHRMHLVGNVSGEVRSSWKGTLQNSTTDLRLDVDPPPNPTPEQVPVTAGLKAVYHGEQRTLDVTTLNAATRAIRLSATGRLGSEKAQATLSVNSTGLYELKPALAALSPGTRIPVLLEGRASFNGTISGPFDALTTRGRLELEDFDSELMPLELSATDREQNTAGHRLQRIHWDSLLADLTYSPSLISLQNGVLHRGRAAVQFSASAGLHRGALDEYRSRVSLVCHVRDAALEDIQTLTGLDYPLSGSLTAELRATGTPADLHGGGDIQVNRLVAYGEPFRHFQSRMQFAGKSVQFNNIVLAHNGAQITGNYAYNFGDSSFRFDLTGENIDLATWRRFELRRLAVEGKATFHLTGSGDPAAPVLNGRLDFRNLVLNQEKVGNVNLSATTRGADLVLTGRSNLKNADLAMDGTVRLRGDWPGQVNFQFSHLDFDPLLRAYFQGQLTGHSSIAGTIDVHGPFKRPRDLIVTGIASQLSAEIQNVKLQNDGPVRFAMDAEVARVQQFHLVGENTDVFVQGNVGVAGSHTLDLHARGRFNLKMLQVYNPNVIAEGPATFSIDVAGAMAHPQFGGRVDLDNANISLADLPNGLSQINGSLVFAQDRIQVEKLTARSGGGDLNVGGFLAYRNGLFWDLNATGKDVRLRYPPGVSSSADARLRYTGTANNSQLTGDIIVTRFGINRRFDFGNYLEWSKRSPVLSTRNPFLDNLRLDVHITSTPELLVDTSLGRVSGDVDLRLRGTAARPALLGRVNIAEGEIFFNGTRYRLERGDISFSNPLSIEPVINMEMSARVQDYDITIGLHGAVTGGKNLSMTYRSDPPLSNADIIALLAFGHTRAQDVYKASQPGQAGSDAANASNAILGQALNSTFSDRVQRLFGSSRVKVDPQFIGAENNPSARVTIEQSINNNITLTYVTNLAQSADTVVQVEYQINKNVSIVAVRDQNGILEFDVHVRRRRR